MAELPLSSDPADDSVKGFALTPAPLVDLMVGKLFARERPIATSRILDPGCGTGEFIAGIVRWSEAHDRRLPHIVGIEQHSGRAAEARRRFARYPSIDIRTEDFLKPTAERYDYIVGNPPYVAITGLTPAERLRYKRDYETATGRFDLYALFLEQALSLLAPDGRLVFVTPEKYLYVDSAASTRGLLTAFDVRELHFLPEDAFDGLVTYPLVSTIDQGHARARVRVKLRDGGSRVVIPPQNGDSWLPAVLGATQERAVLTLGDISSRVSCGVATGADSVFVVRKGDVPSELRRFAHDTMAGRQLTYGDIPTPTHRMLLPYDSEGRLRDPGDMPELLRYLGERHRRERLSARSCVPAKPWYSFHETPPMRQLQQVKLLCKDIGERPHFAVDRSRSIIPRHSVYFIVPSSTDVADDLCVYLNSASAQRWLIANCQRAAKGFLRLQSGVLKRLPVPAEFRTISTPDSVHAEELALQTA